MIYFYYHHRNCFSTISNSNVNAANNDLYSSVNSQILSGKDLSQNIENGGNGIKFNISLKN